MNETGPASSRDLLQEFTVPEILSIGLKTVWSEWKWLIIRAMRTMEIRQLRKRLDEEFLKFGKARLDDAQNDEELRLCRQQISFLEEEISHLEKELDKTRDNYIAKRIEAWKLS